LAAATLNAYLDQKAGIVETFGFETTVGVRVSELI
jgi:hypothetical protein